MTAPTHVYLEIGKTWTFACAIEWPGWARRGKGAEAAIETLQDYEPRYAKVVGRSFRPGKLEIVGELAGNATTDFGAPALVGPWDSPPLDAREIKRQSGLLTKYWAYFDRVAAAAPPQLRKGPRGGGRDRDAIVEHVREAERGGYVPKLGIRVPPRTPWADQREAIAAALSAPPAEAKWPLRYTIRRAAWHVLDHAWEIEDRSVSA